MSEPGDQRAAPRPGGPQEMERHGGRGASFVGGWGIMVLSAAIFGYFGFVQLPWNWTLDGKTVPVWMLQTLTLRGATVAFAVAAGLTMAAPRAGNLLFSCAGVLTALLFVVIAVMDWFDPVYTAVVPPVILLLFAAWNGWASWVGLHAALGSRGAPRQDGEREIV